MQVCVCVRLAAAMNSLTFAQACSRSPYSWASTPSSHLLCKSANLLHCSNCHESPGLPLLSSLSVTIFSKPSWTVPPVQIHTAGAEDSSVKIEHCFSACQRTWTTVWCTSHLLIHLSLSLGPTLRQTQTLPASLSFFATCCHLTRSRIRLSVCHQKQNKETFRFYIYVDSIPTDIWCKI